MVVSAFFGAACSNGISPAPTTVVRVDPVPPGRLVIGDNDAALFVTQPDGSERVDLTRSNGNLVAVQPTWAPDSGRLIWTEANHMSDVPEATIVISDPDGSELLRSPVPAAPFYYSWNPQGSRVAYLADGESGDVELSTIDSGDGRLRGIEQGTPLFFSWAPDGRRILTHVGLSTVSVVEVDGGKTTLAETGARFPAPQWSDDGTVLVFGIGTPPRSGGIAAFLTQTDSQEIVVAEPDGSILDRIESFRGSATFELSPAGDRLAYSITADRKVFNFGPLLVRTLDGGETETVSRNPVVSYQWDPTGSRLLFMQATEGADHPSFRWVVWDGEDNRVFAPVSPSLGYATDYLPFWDQYSHSHSLWAPDGSAFAYPSLDGDGESAIWVQTLTSDTPVRVSDGDVVFWSPP